MLLCWPTFPSFSDHLTCSFLSGQTSKIWEAIRYCHSGEGGHFAPGINLFGAYPLHNSQESSGSWNKVSYVFVLCFINSRYWRGVCLSAKQHRSLKQAGVTPSTTAAGLEEQQGRAKAHGDALSRPVPCCTMHEPRSKAGCFSRNLSAPHPGREEESPGAVCWGNTQSRGEYFRYKGILVSYSLHFLFDSLFLFQ